MENKKKRVPKSNSLLPRLKKNTIKNFPRRTTKPKTHKPSLHKQNPAKFSKLMESPKTKFKLRNILQAIVGATILAIPIGFTEETWRLGETLPIWNIVLIFFLSVLFISLFAYRYFKKNLLKFYWDDLFKRVSIIYLASFFIVALILFLIQKAPWSTDFILALKRTIIVTFPSSLGATIAGSLK